MHSRLRFWKYPIFFVLLLVMTVAFTFFYASHDTAIAPFDSSESPDPNHGEVVETPEIPNEPEDEPEDDQEDEPEDEPEDDQEDEPEEVPEISFVTIQLDSEDIYSGYLILVNQDHRYEIPEDLGLVIITEAKTVPFRVLGQHYYLKSSIIEPLDEMMADFIAEYGYNTVAIISGFRSYDAQQKVLDDYINRVGQKEALRWASRPGHSEHHTGLAIDFGVYSGGTQSTFEGTGITAWFKRNSYRYGFIHRFAQNKTRITGTAHEPWHFRYVGLPHSYIMLENDWCFEEYIEHLRGCTFEKPFEAEYDGVTYSIYFTADTEVQLPLGCLFEISGNNVDGFIVTAYRPDENEALIIDAMEGG